MTVGLEWLPDSNDFRIAGLSCESRAKNLPEEKNVNIIWETYK